MSGRGSVGPVGVVVAKRLRELRQARGLSLRQLAEAIAAEGGSLTADAINKIENGRDQRPGQQVRRVDVDDLHWLGRGLDVSILRLLDEERCPACFGAPPFGFACNACGEVAR